MDMPLISIIIPVYNVELYLKKCLNTIVRQTYPNLEIICVNDGSPDSSGEILSDFQEKDSRIKIINQKNQGLSMARNSGLDAATGDFIVFVDSDDWIELDTIEKCVELYNKYHMDIIMWSYIREYGHKSSPVYVIDESLHYWNELEVQSIFRRMVGLTGAELRYPQKIDNIVTAWGKMYQRKIIGDIRFVDTAEIGTEDALFNIYVFAKAKSIVYIPALFSHYRKDNESSLTHRYKSNLADRWEKMYEYINVYLKKTFVADEFYEALTNRIACGFISLSISLVDDVNLTWKQKTKEIKRLLNLPQYKKSIQKIDISYMPIYWKVFFLLAKKKLSYALIVMLSIMNYLRKH